MKQSRKPVYALAIASGVTLAALAPNGGAQALSTWATVTQTRPIRSPSANVAKTQVVYAVIRSQQPVIRAGADASSCKRRPTRKAGRRLGHIP